MMLVAGILNPVLLDCIWNDGEAHWVMWADSCVCLCICVNLCLHICCRFCLPAHAECVDLHYDKDHLLVMTTPMEQQT